MTLLAELKRKVEALNESAAIWWSPRSLALLETTHYPATDSEREWADEILALDQLLVEGFVERELKRVAQTSGGSLPAHPGALNSLIAALSARGFREDDAIKVVAPLKALHHFRSKVRGHSSPREKEALIKKALLDFTSFRAHFLALASECDASFERVLNGLGIACPD